MKNMLREYGIVVWYVPEDKCYCGKCLEIPAATVTARTPVAALRRCQEALADHIEWCIKHDYGKSLPKPEATRLFRTRLRRLFAWLKRQQAKEEKREQHDLRQARSKTT